VHTVYIGSVCTVATMNRSRRIVVNSALAVVALGALVGGYFLVANPFATASSASATPLTSTVKEGAVSSSITASGSIAPVSEVAASFAVSGTIATVDTTLGAPVTTTEKSSVGDLKSGDTIVVRGEKESSGDVKATSVAEGETGFGRAPAASN